MIEYPIEQQKACWTHVAGDQWQVQIFGTATGYGKFVFPETGVYVVSGPEKILRFVESIAKSKVIRSLGLSPMELMRYP